jgi:hypothetical protein
MILTTPDGVTPCQVNSPTANWDVGVNISPANYETLTDGRTVLKNTATTNAATGIGATITTGHGTSTWIGGLNEVNFSKSTATYGTLLSNPNSTTPAVAPADNLSIFARMVRTSGPVSAGVYTHSIPLNVYYR